MKMHHHIINNNIAGLSSLTSTRMPLHGALFTLLIWLCLTNSVYAADPLLDEEPLIKPKVERRIVKEAKIDTENFEIGVYGGLYSTEDFGTNSVVGARLAYHVSEDFFFELAGGQTETRKSTVEELGFFEILPNDNRTLSYYNISMGYNLLPGEVFITQNWAFHMAFYLIGGVGTTKFAGDNLFTINAGAGYRFIATDWMIFHMDFRDHVFDLDILGVKNTTHNLEATTSITLFF